MYRLTNGNAVDRVPAGDTIHPLGQQIWYRLTHGDTVNIVVARVQKLFKRGKCGTG